MKERIKVIPGGTSAGKTYSIIPILIDQAIKQPNITISIVSESLPHLRKGCIKDFLTIMKTTNRYMDKNWNRTNLVYNFTNGSTIEFFSVEDERRVRGPRRNCLYLNEANLIREDTFTQLEIRTDGDIYLDWNPTHRFWADDLKDVERLVLTYKDNEALSPNIIKSLESKRELALTSSYWTNWCRVYLDGEIGQLEGVVFDNWSIIDIIPDEALLIGYGIDFGYTNDASSCVAVYRYNDEILIDELIYQKGLTMSQMAELLKHHKVDDTIFCDSSDPRSIQELRNFGFSAYATKKGPDSILYGISLMHDYKLRITKRSINLKVELENYKWAIDREGNKLNKPIDSFNHCIDSIRYVFIMRLYQQSNTPMTYL